MKSALVCGVVCVPVPCMSIRATGHVSLAPPYLVAAASNLIRWIDKDNMEDVGSILVRVCAVR